MWRHEDVQALLGGEPAKEGASATLADVLCHHYSIVEGGNVDPYQVVPHRRSRPTG